MRRVSCASTRSSSISRGLSTAAAMARRRDLVEDHPADRDLRAQRLDQVPGDGLALAVLVRREVELVGVLDQRLELADLLLAVGADDVERFEVVLGVDAEPRPRLALVLGRDVGGVARQVADVADRGLDDVTRSEVTADRLGLGRRLDDHQLGARRPPCATRSLPVTVRSSLRRRGRYRTPATGPSTCSYRSASGVGDGRPDGQSASPPARRRPEQLDQAAQPAGRGDPPARSPASRRAATATGRRHPDGPAARRPRGGSGRPVSAVVSRYPLSSRWPAAIAHSRRPAGPEREPGRQPLPGTAGPAGGRLEQRPG